MFETIYLGSDHAGYNLKNKVRNYLEAKGFLVVDLGVFLEGSCDYPDIAREVCEKILEKENRGGVLICGSGTGMNMAANRYKGIRAVYGANEDIVRMGRNHNNANIVTLGERYIDGGNALRLVDVFLEEEFDEGERHKRRIDKMDV